MILTTSPEPATSGSWSISTPTTTISGLNHLNGLTVAILADGSVVSNQVVTNNSITLQQPASNIVIGLPYTCQVQTMYLDGPSQGGTIQNKRKNISAVGLRVEGSRVFRSELTKWTLLLNRTSLPYLGLT